MSSSATADSINAKTTARVRSYFESRDDWNLSRSLKNLIEQAIHDYEHRAVLELIQNAHDAQPKGARDGRTLIRLDHGESEHGTLLVANTGQPFSTSNFDAICDVAQSDKRADEGIGNKGIGFKSTLQLCRIPEIYSASTAAGSGFDGYCFRFVDDKDVLALVDGDTERATELARDVFHLCLPIALGSVPSSVDALRSDGYVTVIRLPLKSEAACDEARREVRALEDRPPTMLFLRRISTLVVEEREGGDVTSHVHERQERLAAQLDEGSTVTEVSLGEGESFLVAERVVDGGAFRAAITSSVEADRISEGWTDWTGEARVGIGVSLDDPLPNGQLYTFLPMGEQAHAPLAAHVNAPFFAKLARVDFEESVPLNDFLLDEVAALAATLILAASSRGLRLPPTAVADLLSWSAPAHSRLVAACEARGQPLASAAVVPLRSPAGGWANLVETRCWDEEENTVFTTKALSRTAAAKLLDESIDGVRLDRVSALAELIVGRELHPDDDEIADWAEALAAAAAKKPFAPRWWETFYDELAAAINQPARLRGRRILIDDDMGLQRCAGSEAASKGPTPFFSPRADDAGAEEMDADLRIPSTLRRQIVFVNQHLRWTERTGQTLSRRPGRRMLDQQTAGLVHEYRAAELFGVLNRALRTRPSPARSLDALRWAYRFVRSREDPPWSEMAGVAFQVPAAGGGWIAASDALFSRAWGAIEDEVLDDFLSRTDGLSDGLDALRGRLLCAPEDWPFDIDDQPCLRQFLERLGVRSGLWPELIPRSVISQEGRWFEDVSAHTSVPLPTQTKAQWRESLRQRAPRNLRPNTNYRAQGSQFALPGQVEYAQFDDTSRRLYAQLVVLGLERWDDSMLEVVIRRHNDPADRFTWPTPAAAFLERTEWVPMARSGERTAWYYVPPQQAWSHGFGDETAPTFAPLVPHALRRLTELCPRARERLGRLGVQFWDTAATAPARVRLLAQLLRDGDMGDTAAAALRKAYEEAWEDVVQHGGADPFDGDPDPWAVVTRKSQLAALPLRADTDVAVAEPIYVQDAEPTQALRLLEQRGAPVVRLRRGSGRRVADILAVHAGTRIRRVSETGVAVRVDGRSFAPSGEGELLVNDERRWLVDLVVSLTELRSGQFRRLGSGAIRRTSETVRRIRVVLAEHIETLVDKEPVQGANRVLALPDPSHPTIVLGRSEIQDEATMLQAAAPAVAELIGYADLADSIRLSLIDLARLGHLDGLVPSLSAIAQAIGESEERLREITSNAAEPLLELARILVPLVATIDRDIAVELWSGLDSFADDAAIAAWLERRVGSEVSVTEFLSAGRLGDLDAARAALGVRLRDLNAAIADLGAPFETLRNPEGIEQAFRYYVLRHRESILAALRSAFINSYRAFEPLDEYVARRDLMSLHADPSWVEEYYDLDDEVIRRHVDAWLAEVGAPPSDRDLSHWPPLDDLRRSNRAVLHELVVTSGRLVRAWETRETRSLSGLPGEPEAIVDAASAIGQLDFEPVSSDRAVAWLVSTDRWPADMPQTFDLAALGLTDDDVDAARQQRQDEAGRRLDAARQISIDGETVYAEPENYAEIIEVIQAGITPALLAIPPKVVDLPTMPPSGGRSGTGGGVTAARRPRLSEVQAGAVGLAGEVVTFEWLRANYEDATDASWRSGYRNLVLGGNEGDDSLGYDFEVIGRRHRLLFEVKATLSDSCEFELTDAEIRAAQRLKRGDRYHVLLVTHVLTSDERAIHLLPNPLGTEGIGRYRTVGSGLRLRFKLE